MSTRGFVTIATGSERYYKMAFELLRSYRRYAVEKIPFAIICDQENNYTKEFDQVILLEHVNCSYMDKLLLYRYLPYDETIFIDADSLILSDPSGIWEDFADQDDVSCYGCTYAVDSKQAWFTYDGCGKYKIPLNFWLIFMEVFIIFETQNAAEIFLKKPLNWQKSIVCMVFEILKNLRMNRFLLCLWQFIKANHVISPCAFCLFQVIEENCVSIPEGNCLYPVRESKSKFYTLLHRIQNCLCINT